MALFAQQGNFDTFLHFLSAFIVRYAEAGCRCAPHGRRVKTGEPARRHRHQRQLTLLYSSRAVTLLLKRFPDSILCYATSWTMYCSQSPPPLHKRFPDSAQVCTLHLARAVWWQFVEASPPSPTSKFQYLDTFEYFLVYCRSFERVLTAFLINFCTFVVVAKLLVSFLPCTHKLPKFTENEQISHFYPCPLQMPLQLPRRKD